MENFELTPSRGQLVKNALNEQEPGAPAAAPEMTTRDYVKVLFRQKSIILLTALTVSLATYAGLKLKTPVYEAQVKMLITAEKEVDSPYYQAMFVGSKANATITQSEIVKSKPVLERAVLALGLQKRPLDYEKFFATPLKKKVIEWQTKNSKLAKLPPDVQSNMIYRVILEGLKKNIKVEPVRDTNIFTITVTDFNSIGAAIIANAVSRSYVIFDLEQQYVDLQSKYTEKNPIVVQMRENITRMEKGLSGQPLPNIEAIGPASVKIIEQASPALRPIGLPNKLTFIVAFFMSIFLGVFLAFMFEFMDQSFHSKQDLENFLGVPVIACINKKNGLAQPKIAKDVSDRNNSPRAVSYRILAQQLHFMAKTKGQRTLLFSPVHPKEDVSIIVANVGVFLSKRLGLRTLIIDADLRHPTLHKVFGEKNEVGLSQLLEGSTSSENTLRHMGEKLSVMTAGRSLSDPGTLLDSTSFAKHLNYLKSLYDIVLIQGSNLRDYRDAALIGPASDGVVVVVGESTVRRQVVQYAVKHLREHRTKVIGAIMPNREYLIPKFLYESV